MDTETSEKVLNRLVEKFPWEITILTNNIYGVMIGIDHFGFADAKICVSVAEEFGLLWVTQQHYAQGNEVVICFFRPGE